MPNVSLTYVLSMHQFLLLSASISPKIKILCCASAGLIRLQPFHRRLQDFLRGSRLKGRDSSSVEGGSNLEGSIGACSPETFCMGGWALCQSNTVIKII